jgi:hypothetical protein
MARLARRQRNLQLIDCMDNLDCARSHLIKDCTKCEAGNENPKPERNEPVVVLDEIKQPVASLPPRSFAPDGFGFELSPNLGDGMGQAAAA